MSAPAETQHRSVNWPLSREKTFTLRERFLEIDYGRERRDRVPYQSIRVVQLLYRGMSNSMHHYLCVIHAQNVPRKVKITNVLCVSLGRFESRDESYCDLIIGLHDKLRPFGDSVCYLNGRWGLVAIWASLALFVLATFGPFAVLAALGTEALWMRLVVAAMLLVPMLVFLAYCVLLARINIPRKYRNDDFSTSLIP
jgi:hypothetical protein